MNELQQFSQILRSQVIQAFKCKHKQFVVDFEYWQPL